MYIFPKKNLNNKFELVESTQNDLLVFKLVSFVFIYLFICNNISMQQGCNFCKKE